MSNYLFYLIIYLVISKLLLPRVHVSSNRILYVYVERNAKIDRRENRSLKSSRMCSFRFSILLFSVKTRLSFLSLLRGKFWLNVAADKSVFESTKEKIIEHRHRNSRICLSTFNWCFFFFFSFFKHTLKNGIYVIHVPTNTSICQSLNYFNLHCQCIYATHP